MNGGLDTIDVGILAMLQENGRVSQHDLAKAVGLSAPAVSDRLKKLEDRGVILGYTALLDPRAVGQDVTAFIAVGINGSKHYVGFRQRARDQAEVMECHSVTGEGSHLLKVRVGSTVALEGLLAEIQAWPGVQWTTTSLVLSTVKERMGVALPEPARDERGPSELLMVPFRHRS